MTKERATDTEFNKRCELARDLIAASWPNSKVVSYLIDETGKTAQQCRTYAREGRKLFLRDQYDEGETVADAINCEYFVLLNDLKDDRLRAMAKEDWVAVASIDKTRLKHIDMGRAIDPGSTSEMELNNYYVQACREHIDDKLKPRKGKIPKESITISTGWMTNAKTPNDLTEQIEEWKKQGLDITGLPKLDPKDDIPF